MEAVIVEKDSGIPDQEAGAQTQQVYKKRVVVATVLGNWLEFFDFTIYSLFAITIGRKFFPVESEAGQLLLSLATFWVGFLTRPIGAWFIGAYADNKGRRAALTLTIALMLLGTAIIGLTPGYAEIGVAAPLLVVFGRLLQGLSAGGEMGAATTSLVEQAPTGRRGFFASWQYASQGLASMVAAVMGFGLAKLLSTDSMTEWGWRIPFLFGLLIGPVGLYIRYHMRETDNPAPEGMSAAKAVRILFRDHRQLMVTSMLTMCGSSVTAYIVGSYFTTYAIHTLGMPSDTALLASVVGGGVVLAGCPLGGWLSDRIGRRPVMIVPRVLQVLSIFPAFLVITGTQSTGWFLLMVGILSLFQAMSAAVVLAVIPECLPRRVRVSGLSIAYSVGVAIFGGSSQFIATWLLDATGNPMALAWYLAAANLVTLVALFGLRPPAPTVQIQ